MNVANARDAEYVVLGIRRQYSMLGEDDMSNHTHEEALMGSFLRGTVCCLWAASTTDNRLFETQEAWYSYYIE